jgi:hypothetical protein
MPPAALRLVALFDRLLLLGWQKWSESRRSLSRLECPWLCENGVLAKVLLMVRWRD